MSSDSQTRDSPGKQNTAAGWPGALLVSLGAAAVFGYFAALVAYLVHPGFTEHLEPAVASIASRFYDELQLFPVNPNDPPSGMVYGPTPYAGIGLWMLIIDDPIFASKFACATAGGLCAAFVAVRFLRTAPWRIALVHTGVLCAWLLLFAQSPYMVTPAAWILLLLGAGVYCVDLKPDRVAALFVGLLLGLTVGCKAHAGLPFLPLLGLLWHRQGWRGVVYPGAVASLVAVLPFTLPNVSLAGYLQWLTSAGKHGYTFLGFGNTAVTVLWMIVPATLLFAAAFKADPAVVRRELSGRWVYWAGLILALGLAMVISLKRGAGVGHLTAFPPILAHATLRMFFIFKATGAAQRWRPRLQAAVVLLYAIALVPAAVLGQRPVWKTYASLSGDLEIVRRDVLDVAAALPGRRIAIGLGDNRGYVGTFVRPVLITAGHPYLLEPVGLMDVQASGVELFPAKLLSPAEVDVWLIPIGSRPFSMNNFYGTGPIFLSAFQESFLAEWRQAGTSRAFDIWMPRERGDNL